MPGAIHFVELLDKLKDPSHLIIPPLSWNRVSVTSALHLCKTLRAANREAYILARQNWKPFLEDNWPQDFFILDEDEQYTIAKRPDWVWLWGLGQTREHSPSLGQFLQGCDTIQVVDWTQDRHRKWGDYVYQTPLLGGLPELAYKLGIEAHVQQKTDSTWLYQAMRSFLNQYSFATQDSPLIHMLGQLDCLPQVKSIPEIEPVNVIEKKPWKIIAYADLNPVSVEQIRQCSLDIYARAGAKHVLFVYETNPGDVFMNIVTSEAALEFKLRQNLRDELPQNHDGSFKLEDIDQLIELLPIHKKDIVEVKPCPWPKSSYVGELLPIECPDPIWELEKERRLEMARVAEEEPEEEEEEDEEEEVEGIDWDSTDLIKRIQSLNREQEKNKPPKLVLTYRDLKESYDIYDRARARLWDDIEEKQYEKAESCSEVLESLTRKKQESHKRREALEIAWKEKVAKELEQHKQRLEERKREEEEQARLAEEEARRQAELEKAEAKRLAELEEEEQKEFEKEHELSEEEREAQLAEMEALREKEEDEEALREFFNLEEGHKDDSDADILHREDNNWNSDALDSNQNQESIHDQSFAAEEDKEGIEYPTYEQFLEAVGPVDPEDKEEDDEEDIESQTKNLLEDCFKEEKEETDEIASNDMVPEETKPEDTQENEASKHDLPTREEDKANEDTQSSEELQDNQKDNEEAPLLENLDQEENKEASAEEILEQLDAIEKTEAHNDTANATDSLLKEEQEEAAQPQFDTETSLQDPSPQDETEANLLAEQTNEESAEAVSHEPIQQSEEQLMDSMQTEQVEEQSLNPSSETAPTEEKAVDEEQTITISKDTLAEEETLDKSALTPEHDKSEEDRDDDTLEKSEREVANPETSDEVAHEEEITLEDAAHIEPLNNNNEGDQVQVEDIAPDDSATEAAANPIPSDTEQETPDSIQPVDPEQPSSELDNLNDTDSHQDQGEEPKHFISSQTDHLQLSQESIKAPSFEPTPIDHDGAVYDEDELASPAIDTQQVELPRIKKPKYKSPYIFDGRNVELDILDKLRQSLHLRKADFIYGFGLLIIIVYIILENLAS